MENLHSEITRLEFELNTILQGSAKTIKIEKEIEIYQKYLFDLLEREKENNNEHKKLEEQKYQYRFWKEGFKAIRQILFENVIKLLNLYVSKYSNELNFNFQLKFFPVIEEKKIEILLKINSQDGETTFENCSSGEKRRIILICNWALIDLFSLFNNIIVPDFVIYDETFTGLDAIGKAEVYKILNTNIQNRKQIFIFDHDPIV